MSVPIGKILAIEDDAAILRIVSRYLGARGYHILQAEDGRAGLELFRSERPDIVLLDLHLPEISGLDLLPIFVEESPDTPVLVVSGTCVMADVVAAMRLGAWDFLVKPIRDFKELENSIQQARQLAASKLAKTNLHDYEEKEQEVRRDRFEQALAMLQQSESLLKSLVDYSPSVIFVKDTAGQYCMVNRRFEELVSLSAGDILGKTDLELFGEETARDLVEKDRRVIEKGERFISDDLVLAGGKEHTFLTTKYPIRDVDGSITGVAGIAMDISTRKQVEEELMRYQERLEELVDERTFELEEANKRLQKDVKKRRKAEKELAQANHELQVIHDGTVDGLMVVDAESKRFLRVNSVICQIFGYSEQEMLSMDVFDIRPQDAQDDVHAIFRELAGRKQSSLEDLPLVKKNGDVIYVDMSVSPVVYHGHKCLMGLIRDTTERKQTQQKLAHYTEALEETNRSLEEANRRVMEEKRAKELLMAMMSHELRTPLHGILSYASFGISNINKHEDEKTLRYFKKIDDSGQELLNMVNDILDLAKLESGKDSLQPVEADIYKLILQEAGELSIIAAKRKIAIHCQPPKQRIVAVVDDGKIIQVVRNLISNAIKHSPDNGTVRVELSRSEEAFKVSVIDEGEGIPEEDIEMIFEDFSQSCNRKAGGTGLGLTICKEIVSAHGGRIRAESSHEGGAVFTFEIPLDKFSPEEGQRETAAAASARP